MQPLAIALAAVAVLATGAWILQDSDPKQPSSGGTPNSPAPTGHAVDPRTGANPSRVDPEEIAARMKAEREQERRAQAAAREAIQHTELGFDPWTTPESTIYQVHHTQDMARLRWEKNTVKGRFVTTWFRKKDQMDSKLIDDVADAHGDQQLVAMRVYNEHSDTKRQELVQSLGLADANHVLNTFAIYKFDLTERNWYRVDASGQKVAFLHDDDGIWENGETNGASWDNHRH